MTRPLMARTYKKIFDTIEIYTKRANCKDIAVYWLKTPCPRYRVCLT